MTSTLLLNELTNLSSEAKRKNNDIRNAAEKSIQELKGLPATSEQQLAADLRHRPAFIDPFLLACNTRNARFAAIGVTCLQRLVISRGLPKSKLQESLEAFNACTDLGLDVQLKILQALPSLLQNYQHDLKGDLLSGALEVCSSLQSAKAQTVSGVAAATLQQLITTVFERVAAEDRHASDCDSQYEVPGDDGPLMLRPAAYDAYRVFRDLALAAEDRKTKFVQFASLSIDASLELIWTCLNTAPSLFTAHAELGSIIRSNVLPLTTRALSERFDYSITLRSLRIIDQILERYILSFPAECEVTLGLLINTLDPDAAPPWKRAIAMEVLRDFFADGTRIVDAYSLFDMAEGGNPVVQDVMSVFVRLSAEKPSVIGLGQQSTAPAGPLSARDLQPETPSLEAAAGGVAGLISSALGVAEVNVAGISSKWSLPRSPCLEQLDKIDPPTPPETYIYALILDCLNSLSDGLAKVVIPLTVHHGKTPIPVQNGVDHSDKSAVGRARSHSYRKRAVPLNPLEAKQGVMTRVQAVNALVDSCWPAVLATSSTFLNAALDDQYYRNLIKAYQRFTQVAGLLRLSTARDALMTTLGKAAVPPHVLTAATAEPPKTPSTDSPRVFSNPKALLSVDTLVSQASSLSLERDRRASVEPVRPMLTTRNLLCLRAQLNLAIALGPTLGTAFAVVIDTLRQADTVLSATTPQQMARQGLTSAQRSSDAPDVVQAFTNEVNAVEAAASRLLESTADYPNDAFMSVLSTFCGLLHGRLRPEASPRLEQTSPPPTPSLKSRTFSGLTGISSVAEMQMRDYKFVLPKLGSLAQLNVSRFVADDPADSGWNILVDELVDLASTNSNPREARRVATDVLCKLAAEVIGEVVGDEADVRIPLQRRTLAILLRLVDGIYADDNPLISSDIEVQGFVVDALRAILERFGESLVAGWNRAIAIISSVFERTGTPPERHDDEEAHIDWDLIATGFVAPDLGRAAFSATQLICSDFLSPLPPAVVPSLMELLQRFAVQEDDLNVSLTAVTLAWNVSDFLLGSIDRSELDSMAVRLKEADDVTEEVIDMSRQSTSAQWLLLLLRLQDVVRTGHKEVRKATFQTVCSIVRNNGEILSPGAWDLTLRSIILRIAFYDSWLYQPSAQVEDSGSLTVKDEDISCAIIAGMSEIIAQHLRTIEQVAQLPSLWEAFLSRLEAYLDIESYVLTASVYAALTRVLSYIDAEPKLWTGPMYRTLHLWLKRNTAILESRAKDSNQGMFVAYVDAAVELYRLTRSGMSTSQTRSLVENVYLCVRHSDGPKYGADSAIPSTLQAKALELLKTVRTDTPATMIIIAAKLAMLHHEVAGSSQASDRPSFLAIASEAVMWLQGLMTASLQDMHNFDADVLIIVLHNLRRMIEEKYSFPLKYKDMPLWRRATSTAVTLAGPTLERCSLERIDDPTKAELWADLVGITSGIVNAHGLDETMDARMVFEDQLRDIEDYKSLRSILVPGLSAQAPVIARRAYARALFDASIVHPDAIKAYDIPSVDSSPLEGMEIFRHGTVRQIPFSPRERMCYECFADLVAMSTSKDSTQAAINLAQAAAPLLILRLAIPVKTYITDQPLRGRRPLPLSQLEELLHCFETIRDLELHPEALREDPIVNGRHGPKTHLRFLYPLLAKAVGVAAHWWSGAEEILVPLQKLLEDIAPSF